MRFGWTSTTDGLITKPCAHYSRIAPLAVRSLCTTPARQARESVQATSSTSQQGEKKSDTQSESEPDGEADAPPPKASLRERLKFLTRRYGWWALGVYLAASTVDFSLTFLAIHLLGADHIRSLETSLRHSIGLEQRTDSSSNEDKNNTGNSAIWTEAVLAYTIHKTLLLPVRVAFTAAVTPSLVKWLVKIGWAKANHQVKAQVARKAADNALKNVAKRNVTNQST